MQFWSDMLQQHPINVVSKANVCIVQCDPLTHAILRIKSKDKIVNEQWTFKLEFSSLNQIFTIYLLINCEQREHILCYDRFQQTADNLLMIWDMRRTCQPRAQVQRPQSREAGVKAGFQLCSALLTSIIQQFVHTHIAWQTDLPTKPIIYINILMAGKTDICGKAWQKCPVWLKCHKRQSFAINISMILIFQVTGEFESAFIEKLF